MGRRRRRVVRIVKKKLPTVFVCPRCGEEAVRVTIAKDTGKATVLCALCNLKSEFQAHPAAQPIDVYSYFTDVFYGVENPRAIIPRDREIPRISEPETIEQQLTPEPSSEELPEKTAQPVEPKPETEEAGQAPETSPSRESETSEPSLPETMESSPEQLPAVTDEKRDESEEEAEPFADIMQNKDKKRYSPNPLPKPQSTEQSN
ncbi:MAG TPA: transcription elongation factor 1 family protein [Candidatus Bathyarchaeia archaeon]|nr:transcription elongation factor 1 family protein [Candidatus Bathyarchaeia archaeon]